MSQGTEHRMNLTPSLGDANPIQQMVAGELTDTATDNGIQIAHSLKLKQVSLKRRASPSFDLIKDLEGRKRLRSGSSAETEISADVADHNTSLKFVEDLVTELQCGCCAELLYRPVMVSPCQHVFCGS